MMPSPPTCAILRIVGASLIVQCHIACPRRCARATMLRVISPQPPPRGGIKSARDRVGHKKSKRNTPSEIKSRASATLAARRRRARRRVFRALPRARESGRNRAVEAAHNHARAQPRKIVQQIDQRRGGGGGTRPKILEFDDEQKRRRRQRGEDLAQRRRRRGAAIGAARGGVSFLDFGEPHFGDRPRAVGRSFESRIVQHDQLAVGGEVGVEFDRIDSQTRRADKSGHRVFGKNPAAAAMRDKQRPRAGAKNGKGGGRRQFGGAAGGRKPES